MKYLKPSLIAAGLLFGLAATPAAAQRYEDDPPMGYDTPEQAMAWAEGFCTANSLEVTGYANYDACVADVWTQSTPGPFSIGDNASYLIALPGGAQACRYYGSPGFFGLGGC